MNKVAKPWPGYEGRKDGARRAVKIIMIDNSLRNQI
jgi:hypothetical protein